MPSEAAVREAVAGIVDPCSRITGVGLTLVEMGIIQSVAVAEDGAVEIRIGLTGPGCHMGPALQEEVEARVQSVPGVSVVEVRVETNLDYSEDLLTEPARRKLDDARADRVLRLTALRAAAKARR